MNMKFRDQYRHVLRFIASRHRSKTMFSCLVYRYHVIPHEMALYLYGSKHIRKKNKRNPQQQGKMSLPLRKSSE
jgi:hypothetical protein